MIAGNSLSPLELRDFLKSLEWSQRVEGLKYGLYVFENEKFSKRQLTYPNDSLAPDDGEMVVRVMEKLSEMLGETPQSLWNRAQSLSDDTLRFRLISEKGNKDSLPLGVVGEMISGVLQMLKSTASSIVQPRIHHPRLGNKKSDQFVEACRFGHTESGSFVLRISCPLNAMDDDGGLDFGSDVEPPFTRRVTQKLWDGVNDSVEAIESDTLDRFVEKIKGQPEPLISANFCEALCKLYDEYLDNTLEFDIDWSAKNSVSGHLKKPIRIQPRYFKEIERVGYQLRTTEGTREETFIGTVEELKGDPGEDGKRFGEVVLLLFTEERSVRVKTFLSSDQYSQAHDAHMKKSMFIKVTGHLYPGRQPRQFKLHSFDIIDKL